jgi:hypothetical protein
MNPSSAPKLRQPEATSISRLPHCIHLEISRLTGAEADEATCFNPYVWLCVVPAVLCRNIKRVAESCLIRLNHQNSPGIIGKKLRQPRSQGCLRLPQVASTPCHS